MQNKKIHVEICAGTTCFVLGSVQFESFEESLPAQWRSSVEVTASRCLGLCRKGKFSGAPYVRINSVPFGNATPEKVMEVIAEMLDIPEDPA